MHTRQTVVKKIGLESNEKKGKRNTSYAMGIVYKASKGKTEVCKRGFGRIKTCWSWKNKMLLEKKKFVKYKLVKQVHRYVRCDVPTVSRLVFYWKKCTLYFMYNNNNFSSHWLCYLSPIPCLVILIGRQCLTWQVELCCLDHWVLNVLSLKYFSINFKYWQFLIDKTI